jgi:large subunit ribosomal protein L5
MANDADKSKNPGGKPGQGRKPEGKAPKASKHAHADADPGPKRTPRLKTLFDGDVRAKVSEKFGLKNPMCQPKIEKIVLNVNLGRHIEGTKIPPEKRQTAIDTLTAITGQKPVVVKARKSVANFKLREGFEIAAMVTLRRERMWNFLDRFINLATPRIKDFRGLKDKAFDKQGNYACGVNEQGVFPEINMAEVTFTHGMNINVCFARSNPALSRFVLECLGMPFVKPEEKKAKKS